MIIILVVAVFLRFYHLSTLPPGLYPDEAANGQDIIRMIENHDFRAIYDTNGPRESLFIIAQGIFVYLGKILNINAWNFTPLSLRIAPAIIGVLTVWGMYFMSKEMFKDKNLGLISAAAMAVSSWHVQFSRNGFRAIMLPFALVFIFYFFIKAYREGKLKDYLWFGVFLAVGFYTYLSIRMIPLVFGAFLIWTFFFDKKFLRKNFKKLLWLGGTFLVLMIPMLISFVQDPSLIAGRASTSIFNPELNNGSALKTFLSNIWAEVKMFNFSGDNNFRHNLGGTPMLDAAVGVFFWIGAAITVKGWKKLENFTLLMLFGAMSLPMILTAESIPHALRLVGVMPVVFVFIALGLTWLAGKIKNKRIQHAFIVLVIIASGIFSYNKYFVDFPSHVEAYDAYTEDMVSIGNDLKENGKERTNILVVGEFGTKTIDFLIYDSGISYQRYETYNLDDEFILPDGDMKIFVQKDWLDAARAGFAQSGNWFNFTPVKSEFDGRVIYYVYER